MEGSGIDGGGILVDRGGLLAGRLPDLGHRLPAFGPTAAGGRQPLVASPHQFCHGLSTTGGQRLQPRRVFRVCRLADSGAFLVDGLDGRLVLRGQIGEEFIAFLCGPGNVGVSLELPLIGFLRECGIELRQLRVVTGLDVAAARREAVTRAGDGTDEFIPRCHGLSRGCLSHPADEPESEPDPGHRHGGQRRNRCHCPGVQIGSQRLRHLQVGRHGGTDPQQQRQHDGRRPRASGKCRRHRLHPQHRRRLVGHGGAKLLKERQEGGPGRQRLRSGRRGRGRLRGRGHW